MKLLKLNFWGKIALGLVVWGLTSPLWGMGTQEKDFHKVQGNENWTYTFNVKDKKPGQYNILVRAKDIAGNTSFAGPYNVFIDPRANLPQSSILIPVDDQRVGGDINILGATTGGEGASKVEIRIDKGKWEGVTGSSFWSYFWKTADVADGSHTIESRATDSQGLTGPISKVTFFLDRKEPAISVLNHPSGSLVAGNVDLNGQVTNLNGVKSLMVSFDGKKTFQQVSLDGDEHQIKRNWHLSLNSAQYHDGPLILWFESKNTLNSEGSLAYLLFIDNTPPKITLLSPSAKSTVHGELHLVGRVEAPMGVKTLSFRVNGGKKILIPITAGDPYFSAEDDVGSLPPSTITVSFEAVDPLGNIGKLDVPLKVDPAQGYPHLSIDQTLYTKQTMAPLYVEGSETWEYGNPSVIYTLNGGPEVQVASGPVFRFEVPHVLSGVNHLTLWPVDGKGQRGPSVKLKVEVALGAPQITVNQLQQTGSTLPYSAGMRLRIDQKPVLLGKVDADNSLKSVLWTVGNLPAVSLALTPGSHTLALQLPLPQNTPFGFVPVQVDVVDTRGKTQVWKSFVWMEDLGKPFGPRGLSFPEVGAKPVVITPQKPLVGWFQGAVPKKVEFRGAARNALSARVEGQRIIIKPTESQVLGKVELVVFDDKDRPTDATLASVIAVSTPPTLKILTPQEGAWVPGQVEVSCDASSPLSGLKVSASWDAVHWVSLNSNGSHWKAELSTLPNQAQLLTVKAEDAAGQTVYEHLAVRAITTPPTIVFSAVPAMPPSPGEVLVSGQVTTTDPLALLQATVGGKTLTLPLSANFVFPADPTQPIVVKAVDQLGNTSQSKWSPPPGLPVGQTLNPQIVIVTPGTSAPSTSGEILIVGRLVGFSTLPSLSGSWGSGWGNTPTFPVKVDAQGWFSLLWKPGQQPSLHLSATLGKLQVDQQVNLPFDPQADAPTVQYSGSTGAISSADFALALNGTGKAVTWKLDGGNPVSVPGYPGVFHLSLPQLAPGKHEIDVAGVNTQGSPGNFTTITFRLKESVVPPPVFDLPLGADIASTTASVTGSVAMQTPQTASYFVGAPSATRSWLPLNFTTQNGKQSFSIPLPPSLPYGRLNIWVKFVNQDGVVSEAESWVHKIWPIKVPVDSAEGLRWNDAHLTESNEIHLATGGVFPLAFYGRDLQSVRLIPGDTPVKLHRQGSQFSLSSEQDGVWGPVRVEATTVDGDVFRSERWTFFVGSQGPAITVDEPVNGAWVRDNLVVSGSSLSIPGVKTAQYSVDRGSTWHNIHLRDEQQQNGKIEQKFHFEIPFGTDLPQGLIPVWIALQDRTGVLSQKVIVVDHDSIDPEFQLITPPLGVKVIGKTTIVGNAKDPGGRMKLVEWSADGKHFEAAKGTNFFQWLTDFSSYDPLPKAFYIRLRDEAGNVVTKELHFPVDVEARKPVVQIQTPDEGQIIRSDFLFSGMAFDYAGVKSITWRLDSGPWTTQEVKNGFSVPISLNSLTDNEHTFEVYATNIYGNVGNVSKRLFKVSLSEPVALVAEPTLGATQRQSIVFQGASFDRNGIAKVEISTDNGKTWNQAELLNHETWLKTSPPVLAKEYFNKPEWRKQWTWAFDTQSLQDGTYSFLIRSTDSYGTVGISSTLVSIDNTPPVLELSRPLDGEGFSGGLHLEGRVTDNGILRSVHAEVRPLSSPTESVDAGPPLLEYDLPLTRTFTFDAKPKDLRPGWYNVRVEAVDSAGNITRIARNIRWEKSKVLDRADLLYPLSGQTQVGKIDILGHYVGVGNPQKAEILLDGQTVLLTNISKAGYFHAILTAKEVTKGSHVISARIQLPDGRSILSETRTVLYDPFGPWVTVDSPSSGDFVSTRPWIEGQSGWALPPLPKTATNQQKDERNQFLNDHQVVSVAYSLDDGKTFVSADGNTQWKFRLENLGLPDGPLPILVRALFRDGTLAYTNLYVTQDQTPPRVVILEPIENASFRREIPVAGWATDNYQLSSVKVALRTGNKHNYEVPSFIQGLYTDADFWGATYWATGVGLTFFNDNVKLQAMVAQAPDGRFSGMVSGAKLIANIARIPFSYFLGPDWDWFSMSVGIGANFSYFSMGAPLFNYSQGVFLGSVLGQWEFAKISFADNEFFKYISLYSEMTAWFISSDVFPSTELKLSGGIRIGLF